jgi:hypothetical protein
MTAQLHLAVDALALQLLLERAQRLLDIIVANDDLHIEPVTLLVFPVALPKYLKGGRFSSQHDIGLRRLACGGERAIAARRRPFKARRSGRRCDEPWGEDDGKRNQLAWLIGR